MTNQIPWMDRIIQKDALEQSGPMGLLPNITAMVEAVDLDGGESAANLNPANVCQNREDA